MTLPTPLTLSGAPGSPYTKKMLAVLRYRRIPYRVLWGLNALPSDSPAGLPKPKVSLLPTFYLPNESGDLEAVVDSSPLIRRFEKEFDGRNVIPSDPAVAFLDHILEDYGDEWLTKAMFHYRWYYEADIDRAGEVLPRWRGISAPEEEIAEMKKFFSERQISRLYVVGSNDTTAPIIESSYERFLQLFHEHLQKYPFLMGNRPGSSDFAAYGQLTQLTHFDPTPMELTLKKAPRVYAWVDLLDDLSGVEPVDNDWVSRDQLGDALKPLFAELGRAFVPVMLANAAALERGEKDVKVTVDGAEWVQQSFPYQGKCVQWIREAYQALNSADRDCVDAVLSGTGCEPLVRA